MCNKAFLTILSLWFSEEQKEKKHKQKRNIIIYDENAAMAEAFYFVSSFAATEQFPTENTCFIKPKYLETIASGGNECNLSLFAITRVLLHFSPQQNTKVFLFAICNSDMAAPRGGDNKNKTRPRKNIL